MFVEFGSLRSMAIAHIVLHRKLTIDERRRPPMVLIIGPSMASGGGGSARRRPLCAPARAVAAVA